MSNGTTHEVGDSWTDTISDTTAIHVDWKSTNPVVQKFEDCFTITITVSVVKTVVTQDVQLISGGPGFTPERLTDDVVTTETTLWTEDYTVQHSWGENLHNNIYGLLPTIQAGIDKYLKQVSIVENGQGAVNMLNSDVNRTLIGWKPSG